ncbi:MAG: sugar ABC transporter permease [Clostridia bacterium]|nr:sugar ABC transporter permease [Clostridia bacterium]
MPAGYFARGQIVKGALVGLLQGLLLWSLPAVFWPYLLKFDTLGSVVRQVEFNLETMTNVENNYDHSFKILLFSLLGIVVILAGIIFYMRGLHGAKRLCDLKRRGKHINTFREDLREYVNHKFHMTLLSLPVLGVMLLTVIPLLVMILVGFTNYDQTHMPPTHLFTWAGFANFKTIFTSSVTVTFGYAFSVVIVWTLIWAFFATFTNYYGGILLAMFINNRKTRLKKMWRSLFVVAIAVPQFVSLLLVRNFFANQGVVNTIFANMGITDALKNIGLVPAGLNYVPFLTHPTWARVMIILINVWVGVPYLLLIATGVLMNIPADLTEAARIDGASSFQNFRHITMPYVRFVTGPYVVTSFVANINNFNIIYLLTQDVYRTNDQFLANSNAKEIDLLVTWLYRLTQEYYNYKMASVIGILIFVICAFFTVFAFRRLTKGDKEEMFQ